jgi:hypothetical protein
MCNFGHRIVAPDGIILVGAHVAGWRGRLVTKSEGRGVHYRDLAAKCGDKGNKIPDSRRLGQPPVMTDVAAPLTASEKVTLRRIALGSTSLLLPEEQVSRLERLNLIEAVGGGYQLTPMGRERYEALPRPMSWAVDSSPAATIEQMLSEVVQSLEKRKQKSRRQHEG